MSVAIDDVCGGGRHVKLTFRRARSSSCAVRVSSCPSAGMTLSMPACGSSRSKAPTVLARRRRRDCSPRICARSGTRSSRCASREARRPARSFARSCSTARPRQFGGVDVADCRHDQPIACQHGCSAIPDLLHREGLQVLAHARSVAAIGMPREHRRHHGALRPPMPDAGPPGSARRSSAPGAARSGPDRSAVRSRPAAAARRLRHGERTAGAASRRRTRARPRSSTRRRHPPDAA